MAGRLLKKMIIRKTVHPLSVLTLKNPQAFIFNIYSQNRDESCVWDGMGDDGMIY